MPHWFSQALTDFEGPLLRYAQSLLGDAEQARDIVQETFLKLHRDPPERTAGLAPWLYRVCRNRALDWMRRSAKIIYLDGAGNDSLCPVPAPSEALEAKDEAARLVAAVDGLPANQREVVRLKFQHELSYREIAEITGLSESNVGYLLHAAMKTLREMLSQPEPKTLPAAKTATRP